MQNSRSLLPLPLLPLLFLLAAPACDDPDADSADDEAAAGEDEEAVDEVEFRGWGYSESTVKLNTNIVNGSSINTVRFGAPSSYGSEVSYISVPLFNSTMNLSTVQVIDGAIQGTTVNGQFVPAHGFEGGTWIVTPQGGVPTSMVLEDVRYASEVSLANEGSKMMTNLDPDRIVYKWKSTAAPAYGTKVDPKTGWGGTWDGLHTCATDPKGQTWGVMYRGLIVNETTGDLNYMGNPNQYAYLACLSGRIGKTSLWGYAPDNPSADVPDLTLAEFEGAHRMVGAEYCGDGRSFTRPGEAVTLVDKWGINQHQGEAITDEAAWTLAGVKCIGTPRWEAQSPNVICNGVQVPACGDVAAAWYGWFEESKWWTKNATFPD